MDAASEAAAAREQLAARYGTGPRGGHRLGYVVVAILAALLAAWAVWAAVGEGNQPSGQLRSYDVVSAHRVKVSVDVQRPTGSTLRCTVRALATDHSVVGQIVLVWRRGQPGAANLSGVVRTDREATAAALVGCR